MLAQFDSFLLNWFQDIVYAVKLNFKIEPIALGQSLAIGSTCCAYGSGHIPIVQVILLGLCAVYESFGLKGAPLSGAVSSRYLVLVLAALPKTEPLLGFADLLLLCAVYVLSVHPPRTH